MGRISSIDRAWLLMDRPTHPMVVVGLIVFESALDLARLRERIAARFLAFERFRCCPASDAAGATWIEAGGFDIQDHVLCTRLAPGAGQSELEALVGEVASTPFSPGRPLWTFHLVENYQAGSAVIVRIHHCYADGIALIQVLLALTDESPAGAGAGHPVQRAGKSDEGLADSMLGLLPELAALTLRGGAQLIEKGIHYALHPLEASSLARDALGIVGELAHITALSDDPRTHLKQPLVGIRRAAWADPLSLEELHTIGHVLGCTVNDVLVSTLAGALGSYLESQGDKIAGLTIRATVPVNLRTSGTPPATLGNCFGLVFVELPIGIRHPLERLYTVRRTMQALKSSPQAQVTLGLLTALGSLPAAVEDQAMALFSAKASLVASNLPGPREPLHLAGARVAQLLFWVPSAGEIGTGVSMISYRGQVQVGIIVDRGLIPRPAQLVGLIGAEFEKLVLLVLLGGASLNA
ncbi:MAG: wax ester/triacylglycerol synthase family O-acyltransferase [Proteobacteria bacterium]|nr:wax ester/triacylglycerol synthase family O-acyltransferase [Pseudomonadota bacterium]